MTKRELENWQKVKDGLEASGNTDNFYYQRAVAITAGGDDPLDVSKIIEETDDELE